MAETLRHSQQESREDQPTVVPVQKQRTQYQTVDQLHGPAFETC